MAEKKPAASDRYTGCDGLFYVRPVGLEPTTCGLKVRSSTN